MTPRGPFLSQPPCVSDFVISTTSNNNSKNQKNLNSLLKYKAEIQILLPPQQYYQFRGIKKSKCGTHRKSISPSIHLESALTALVTEHCGGMQGCQAGDFFVLPFLPAPLSQDLSSTTISCLFFFLLCFCASGN